MDGDAYRDMSHGEMKQLIWRKVAKFADYANTEQHLSNGRIADVYYQVGRIRVVVEVKTQLKASLVEAAWNKYHNHCDYLAIACPPQLMYTDTGGLLGSWAQEQLDRVGLWWVEWHGLTQIRPACRIDVKTPGHVIHMSPASSPFAVIASPGCTAGAP
jgi:hypothetical protein